MIDFIYKEDDIGIRLLSDFELSGGYPSWFSDMEVHQYNSHWAIPKTFREIENFVSGLSDDKSQVVFAVYSVSNLKHIGNISLQNIDYLNQCAEIAFLFGEREYWGKGYAKKASKIIINHGFQYLNLHRIYLGCLEINIAMKNLSVSLGFFQEGVRRKSIYSNNEFFDVIEFGMLKDEFS